MRKIRKMQNEIRNEFDEIRDWDEILASGYITAWEYLGRLRRGIDRDDLDDPEFLEKYGIEGEWAYGVNMTPSRYVRALCNLMKERTDCDIIVINLKDARAEYMDWGRWDTLTGDLHREFQKRKEAEQKAKQTAEDSEEESD